MLNAYYMYVEYSIYKTEKISIDDIISVTTYNFALFTHWSDKRCLSHSISGHDDVALFE